MTVKEIFALRKQGQIEEAYEAIRPMYSVHKGKYTTLCMFWTAHDVFNLRIQQGRTEEAAKIYEALKRLVPSIEDKNGSVSAFMDYAHRRLEALAPTGSLGVAVPAGSPSSSGSPYFSGESVPAPPASPAATVPAVFPAGLNSGQQAVLDYIKANPGLRVPKLSETTNIPSKSIERHISLLIERNLIEHRGSKKTGGYHALNSTFGRLPLGSAAFTKRSD